MSSNADTIFALATPPGRGAIAIIRLSGPGVDAALSAMGAGGLTPRLASLRTLRHDGDRDARLGTGRSQLDRLGRVCVDRRLAVLLGCHAPILPIWEPKLHRSARDAPGGPK